MTCPGCKEEFDDFDHEEKYNTSLGIALCEKCDERVENHHLIDGKYTVHKCKCCGNITSLEWVPYKKRGRPAGTKNKETTKQDNAQKHLTKWTGEPKTLEEFVYG